MGLDSFVHLHEEPSKTLQSEGRDSGSAQLHPKAQGSNIDDCKFLVHVSGVGQQVEVQPVVIVDSAVLVLVVVVDELGFLLVQEASGLYEIWFHRAPIDEIMRIGEVEYGEVANGVSLSVPRYDAPQTIGLVGHHDTFLSLRPNESIDHEKLHDDQSHRNEDRHPTAGVVSTGLNSH